MCNLSDLLVVVRWRLPIPLSGRIRILYAELRAREGVTRGD
jgi:hypothetical protein